MDELTEDEVNSLRASSKAWYKLPESCNHNGLPLYIKLCTDMNKEKNTLIVLLTDIRSSLWMEYFGESRAIHIRIKVSARETPKSTYADLKEKEAVAKMFEDLDAYTNTLDGQATIESKSESEMEVVLQLNGLSFRLRLDMVSPALQSRLLYDLIYLPLLGIANAVQHGGSEALPALQHAIDLESKKDSLAADSEVLSAMQRFSQGSAGVLVKNRVDIRSLKSELPKASPSKARSSPPKSSSKKATSKSTSAQKNKELPEEEVEEEDADKTMLSSPEPDAGPSKSGSTIRENTASPSPAKHTRASIRIANSPSPSPSPPLSTKSKNKGKARHIVDSDEGAGGDSDATQESDTEQGMQVDEVSPHKKSKMTKEQSPPAKQTSRERSPSPALPPPAPSPTKTRKKTPTPENEAPAQSSPQAAVLKRPAAGARGMPPKRGKRPGMQWSNFG